MKLLVYTGKCQSEVINGIKFTQVVRTAVVNDEVASTFQNNSVITISDIDKKDIAPDKGDKNPEWDIEKLKKAHNLDVLQEMCKERELSVEGSKTELAERIVTFETEKVAQSQTNTQE